MMSFPDRFFLSVFSFLVLYFFSFSSCPLFSDGSPKEDGLPSSSHPLLFILSSHLPVRKERGEEAVKERR